MASTCICCSKKMGFIESSNHLSDKFNKDICDKCFFSFYDTLSSFKGQDSKEGIERRYNELVEYVDKSNFTEDGKSYIFAYAEALRKQLYTKYENKVMQEELSKDEEQRLQAMMLTTGFNFEGYNIKKYSGIVHGEVVLGTGFLSDLSASFNDMFGTTSEAMEGKLSNAKRIAQERMIANSIKIGANAIIGVDFDVNIMGSNMIVVSTNGTAVVIEQQE